MKPEHFKEFNVEHAKAGAPYCQRNGLAARIGIWERSHPVYQLSGDQRQTDGKDAACSWTIKGLLMDRCKQNGDLVMLPLGYCEGKPVFVGDELMSRDRGLITVTPMFILANECSWPRTAPVMPKSELWLRSSDQSYTTPDEALAHAIYYQRKEIEAYWKALDEFNGVKA